MLTISEFSRLCRVSPRMLRHYDALGLLCPESVGENGYRYYRQEQLAHWVRIERLKDYGFPLAQIPQLLALDDASLLERLRAQRDVLRLDLEQRNARLCRLEADLLRQEGTAIMQQYHVILMSDPAQRVFSVRKTLGVDQFHALFEELRAEAAKRGLHQAGPIQVLYHQQEFDHNSSDVEAQMVVAEEGPDVTVKPAYTCATVEHRGSYETLHLAYEAVCGWLAEHTQYRVCAPAMDRYLNDPHQVSSPGDLRTGVLFPVEKVN